MHVSYQMGGWRGEGEQGGNCSNINNKIFLKNQMGKTYVEEPDAPPPPCLPLVVFPE